MPGQDALFENFKERLNSMERHSSSESAGVSERSAGSDESKQQMKKVLIKLLNKEEPTRRTIVDYIDQTNSYRKQEKRNTSEFTSNDTSMMQTFSPEC